MQKTKGMQLRYLGGKDLLKKKMATHSSILAVKIPWTEKLDELQSMGSQRVRHNSACMHVGTCEMVRIRAGAKVLQQFSKGTWMGGRRVNTLSKC